MFDLIIRNANLPDGRTGVDITVENGTIAEVGPHIKAQAAREIDATDRLRELTGNDRAGLVPARGQVGNLDGNVGMVQVGFDIADTLDGIKEIVKEIIAPNDALADRSLEPDRVGQRLIGCRLKRQAQDGKNQRHP